MAKSHLKRINAPRTWNIKRKVNKFIIKPNPGGQELEFTIPLHTLFKEMLGLVKNNREMNYILKTQKILVDGKPRYTPKYPVGLMDVVEIPLSHEAYRLLINEKNLLYAKKTKQPKEKIVRIQKKTILKKGLMQLNLSDGRNLLVKKDSYKTGDSLLLEIPSQEIKEHLVFEKQAWVYLLRGNHVGSIGTVEDIKGSIVKVMINKEKIETPKAYALVIGKTKPAIEL